MSTTIEAQALEVKATYLTRRLDALRIENLREAAPPVLRRSLEESVIIRNLADDFLREVDATVGGTVEAAFRAHRAAVAMRDGLKKPAEVLKKEAGELGYLCDRELKRRQAEAERLAAEERDRLQREADLAAAIERAAALRAEEDARLAQASALEAKGDHVAASRLLEAPVEVPVIHAAPVFVPPAPQIAPAKVEGASFTEQWGDFIVEDEALIPREYLMPDAVKIRRVVAALKKERPIPGIKATPRGRTSRTGR